MNLNYNKTFFISKKLKSNKNLISLIDIAFFGYSNVGKSSVINALVKNKHLARVSKTPGRTQAINFFQVVYNLRLVDLPGYGYSIIQKEKKKKIEKNVLNYVTNSKNLKGLVNIMDIRNPLKNIDLNFIEIINKRNLPILILLNKSDKISSNDQKKKCLLVKNSLLSFSNIIDINIFSSFKNIGIKNLKKTINFWYIKHCN